MRKLITILILNFSFLIFHSVYADYWTPKSNYIYHIVGTAGFAIGNMGYAGTGFYSTGSLITNFRAYNLSTTLWSAKATFSGDPRFRGTGLAIDSVGYLGLGIGANNDLQDWWKYSPASNTWTQKADFAGGPIRDVASFTIGSYGYIATGGTNYSNQLWQYDPASNSWLQMANCPGAGRQLAVGFAIAGKGYIGTGYNGSALNDFWEYNPVSNSWLQKASLPASPRWAAAAFAIGNFGYIGLGNDNSNVLQDFWEYNPVTNQWIQKTDFGGVARHYTFQFVIGSKGYIGTGLDQSTNFLNDFWEYTPDSPLEAYEYSVSSPEFIVYPNPAKEFIVISSEFAAKEKMDITITDINGKKVFTQQMQTLNFKLQTKIDVRTFPNGIYFVRLLTDDENQKAVKKFVKQ